MSSNMTRLLECIVKNILNSDDISNETSTDSELHYLLNEYLCENVQFHEPDGKRMPKIFSLGPPEYKEYKIADEYVSTLINTEKKEDPKKLLEKIQQTINVLENDEGPGEGAEKWLKRFYFANIKMAKTRLAAEEERLQTYLSKKSGARGTQMEKERPVIVILCADTESYKSRKSWTRIKNTFYFRDEDYNDYIHYYVGLTIDETAPKKSQNDILIQGNINDAKVQSKIPPSIFVLINEWCSRDSTLGGPPAFPHRVTKNTINDYLDKLREPGSMFVNFYEFKPSLRKLYMGFTRDKDNDTYIYVKNEVPSALEVDKTRLGNRDKSLAIQKTTVSASEDEKPILFEQKKRTGPTKPSTVGPLD